MITTILLYHLYVIRTFTVRELLLTLPKVLDFVILAVSELFI